MRTIFSILSVLLTIVVQAQTVNGKVKNQLNQPVQGATIALHQKKDSSLVKLQVSDANGFFNISADQGQYFIIVTSVGFNTINSLSFFIYGDTTIADIIIKETLSKMNTVVISTKKPLVQVKADRMILNVDGTINATGNTVLELLRKSPGVTVNSNDRISMNSKNGVQVFIDGKPSPLSGDDLASYLKSISSSEVDAIELITHPSAKYEAAGNAGIINIKLKKNKTIGTNASLSLGYNKGAFGKYNSSLTINHRTNKFNLFGNLGYNNGITQKHMFMNRTTMDSSFRQNGTLVDETKTVNIKTGMDYFISKEKTLGFMMNGSFGNTRFTNNSHTIIAPQQGTIAGILKADNSYQSSRDHMNFNLNYLYSGKEGKNFNLDADYGFYSMKGSQLQPNFYYDGTGQNLINTVTYEMITPTNIDIYSLKGDYEQSLLKGKLGAGFKASFVNTDNDFQRYDIEPGSKTLDHERSNHFAYKENINAVYINYQRQLKKLQMQIGLRAENTHIKGISSGKKQFNGNYVDVDSTSKQNYTDLFPNIGIQYSKNPDHQFNFSLSRRIDRPAYQDLNPFELKVDDYLIQKGNAYLRPQYTNSAGISYVFKQKFNTSLNYSHVKDLAAWIVDTTETSKSLVSKKNLASQDLVSFNISYPWQYKNFSMFANVNTSYASYQGNFGNGRSINEKAFGMNMFVQNNLKFAGSWTTELTGFYYAPSLQEGNMKVRSFWSMDAGVQKKFFNDKATLKLSVSDIFNSLQFRSSASFAGQLVQYNTKNETRQIKLSLVFKLGSRDIKEARSRKSGAEDEMKRVN